MVDNVADWASILGVLVSIGGFLWTVVAVIRSKRAAEQAKAAADATRDEILRSDALMEVASAVTAMEEIKRLQRERAWRALPDRYSALRASLISIRASRSGLEEKHLAAIQGAIEQFRTLEKRIERATADGQSPPNVATINEVVSIQIENVAEILGALRARNGD